MPREESPRRIPCGTSRQLTWGLLHALETLENSPRRWERLKSRCLHHWCCPTSSAGSPVLRSSRPSISSSKSSDTPARDEASEPRPKRSSESGRTVCRGIQRNTPSSSPKVRHLPPTKRSGSQHPRRYGPPRSHGARRSRTGKCERAAER